MSAHTEAQSGGGRQPKPEGAPPHTSARFETLQKDEFMCGRVLFSAYVAVFSLLRLQVNASCSFASVTDSDRAQRKRKARERVCVAPRSSSESTCSSQSTRPRGRGRGSGVCAVVPLTHQEGRTSRHGACPSCNSNTFARIRRCLCTQARVLSNLIRPACCLTR